MTKRLVDIDDDLLARARQAAGTPTIRATVEAGLRRLAESECRTRHVAWLRSPDGPDLAFLDEARAPRWATDD